MSDSSNKEIILINKIFRQQIQGGSTHSANNNKIKKIIIQLSMKCILRICWGVKLAAVPDSGELVAIKKICKQLAKKHTVYHDWGG